MNAGIVSPVSLLGTPAVTGSKPSKAEGAAQQFESLLLSEMLKSARESAASLGGEEDDSETSTMLDVSDQQFAQMMTKNGGIGLTRMVTAGLHTAASEH